jgi:predicted permease
MPRHRPPPGSRAFRALLALYPAAFRDEYRREMTLVFADRYRDADGAAERAWLWIEAVTDLLIEAPKEHGRMMVRDLRYAWHSLRRQPMLTATIVIVLGFGLGANMAIFSLLNAMTARTLGSIPHPDELVAVNTREYALGGPEGSRLSGPMFERLRDAAPAGVNVAAMSRGIARVYTRTADERETTPASVQLVSSDFFSLVGAAPALGRSLPDDRHNQAPDAVAVISYGYWQRRFGGAADVVGRVMTINNVAFTIVGVGPRAFTGVWLEAPVDVWVPLAMQSDVKYSQNFSADGADLGRPWLTQPNVWWLHVVARVPSSRSAAVAGVFNATLSSTAGADAGLVLQPFSHGFSQFRQRFMLPLQALFVMTALVLLIACANVANLLLSRAIARQREIGVRLALGAGRSDLLRLLLAESALLIAFATIAALALAHWTSGALARAAAATADAAPLAAPIDWRVLGFAALSACLSMLLCGVFPAWRATRVNVLAALRSGGRGATIRSSRIARALVVAQIALSLVLVTGTGLFVRSFHNLQYADLGIDASHLLSVRIDPRLSGEEPSRLPAMYARVIDAVSAAPGVRAASFAMCGLDSSCATQGSYAVEGRPPRKGESVDFRVNVVSPAYFSTVGMPIVAGRALDAHDTATAPRVAVVNKTLAETYFPNGAAIGRRVGLDALDTEIIGVVEDARALNNIAGLPAPAIFMALAQQPIVPRSLTVRTVGDPGLSAETVRMAIGAAAPLLPIESMTTVDEQLARGLSRDRLATLLTTGLGVLALGLAGFGLFGVISYAVSRRTSEFGVRMALGASPASILRQVMREALALIVVGAVVGAPLVWIAGRAASTLFFGVSPHDWITMMAALFVLSLAGIACSLRPAWRAASIDPVIALRQE